MWRWRGDRRRRAGELSPFRNLHRDGILAVTQWPARTIDGARWRTRADAAARTIAQALDYVGVLCVEFFVDRHGTLYANEMAPRPHNSGHCTIDACDVSQFEWQVRTMAGLPLPAPRVHSNAVMLNLLGDLWRRRCRPGLARRLGAVRCAFAPVRQAAGASWAQDGAPDVDGGQCHRAADVPAREAAQRLGLPAW